MLQFIKPRELNISRLICLIVDLFGWLTLLQNAQLHGARSCLNGAIQIAIRLKLLIRFPSGINESVKWNLFILPFTAAQFWINQPHSSSAIRLLSNQYAGT